MERPETMSTIHDCGRVKLKPKEHNGEWYHAVCRGLPCENDDFNQGSANRLIPSLKSYVSTWPQQQEVLTPLCD